MKFSPHNFALEVLTLDTDGLLRLCLSTVHHL